MPSASIRSCRTSHTATSSTARSAVAPNDVEHAVVNVLRYYDYRASLVFCATRDAVRRLHANLSERGFSAVALSGELSQAERTHALQSLRDGRSSVCVATDVAARGLDLPGLGLVIHADLPNDPATLLHRSGRTGRAGGKGICALIVPYTRRRKAEVLIRNAGVDATWMAPPTAEEIRTRDQERLVSDPLLAETSSEEDLILARALLAERSAEDIAAALIRMHRSRLPAPEDILDTGPARDTRDTRETRDTRNPKAKRDEWSPVGDQAPRPPSDNRRPTGPMTWFRMSVGRRNNADPRWLLPMICRLGHVTKKEIGAIKIADRETKFEVVQEAAARFAAAVLATAQEDIRIQPDDGGPDQGRPAPQKKAPRSDRPFTPRQNAPAHHEAGDPPRKKPFRDKREGEKTGPDRAQNRVQDQSFRGEGPKVIKPRRPGNPHGKKDMPGGPKRGPGSN